jgi:DNA-binding NarL/FixJ family response regulator
MKIVLIDDNKEFLENLKYFVENKLGHSVIGCFTNGLEFFGTIPGNKPDIVLMDISMPEIDGYTLTKMLNWNYVQIKVIAITMFNNKAYLEKLIGAGFKGCVFKSDVFKELPLAIEQIVKGDYYWPNDIND